MPTFCAHPSLLPHQPELYRPRRPMPTSPINNDNRPFETVRLRLADTQRPAASMLLQRRPCEVSLPRLTRVLADRRPMQRSTIPNVHCKPLLNETHTHNNDLIAPSIHPNRRSNSHHRDTLNAYHGQFSLLSMYTTIRLHTLLPRVQCYALLTPSLWGPRPKHLWPRSTTFSPRICRVWCWRGNVLFIKHV